MLALRSGSVDVSDLARRFDVTTETIRRDLSDLQERQLLRRVHGGAVPFERLHHEPMVDARDMLNAEEKLRIGREAIHEVPEHGSVIVDSGSTGQRFAEVFPVDRRVHVVTNSLLTAATLVRRGVARGHGARRRGADEHVRDGRRVDGGGGAGAAGRRAVHQLRRPVVPARTRRRRTATRALLKRAMIESARRVVAMVDQSKFGNDQMFSYAALDEIDVLVTDTRVDDDALTVLAEHDLEVRRA